MILILISSVTLAYENPLDNPYGQRAKIIYEIDLVLTLIFAVEMLLKMFAFGIICNGKDSYFRKSENFLDFFVVICGLLSIFLTVDLRSLKILRLLRVLRPIRLISKNEGLKISI